LELDEYKREVDVIETKYKTKQQLLLEKQSKQTNNYYIIIALNHYSFLLFFQNTKLKQKKTNSKTFKVKFKKISSMLP
jgi:hypothetical protein